MTTANDICAVCEQHPEDILMLECTHDLCVGCAAEIFSKANRKSSVFVCEICLAQTVLDRETVECLESAVKDIRKQTPKHTHNRSNNMPVASNNPNPVASLPPIPPKQPPKPQCPQHKQPLLYFCFDCKTGDICAQCILTQRHRNHQVSTFKKAASQITKLIESQIKQKQLIKTKVLNDKKKITEGYMLFKSQVESRKKELKIFFEELNSLVVAHSQRLTQQLEEIAMGCEATIRGQLDITECKISELSLEIQRLKESMKDTDKMSFFNYTKKTFEIRPIEYRIDTTTHYVEIDYPREDIIDELMALLQRITVRKERPLANSRGKHYRTEGQTGGTIEHTLESEPRYHEKSTHTSGIKSTKKQLEVTPSRPQLKHSLDMASNIISKIQTRQKRFE